MFDVPSKANVKEVLIDDKVINMQSQPTLVFKSEEEIKNTAKPTSDPAESA
jgi:ATP-dependent Clp protease ATP-binding subunit ClpX